MKIDKHIPVPQGRAGDPGVAKYPFAEMNIGDSVLFDEFKSTSGNCSPATAARVHAHRTGKKFAARKTAEGVRIWRIA